MPEDKKDRSGLSTMHHRGPIKRTQPPAGKKRKKIDPMVDAIGMTREELDEFRKKQVADTMKRLNKNDDK